MSHFTRITTRLRDLAVVERALRDLGFKVSSARQARGYGGQRANVDLVIQVDSRHDIGFRREGDSVAMVADFWGLELDRKQFMNELTQRYAYLTIMDHAQANGWQVTGEETQPDGSIRLVVERWA